MSRDRTVTEKWPMIRDKTIKFRDGGPDITVGATVAFNNGRAYVEVRLTAQDPDYMFPAEAERYARALLAAAKCCRDKERVARACATKRTP